MNSETGGDWGGCLRKHRPKSSALGRRAWIPQRRSGAWSETLAIAAILILAELVASPAWAQSYQYKILHNFGSQNDGQYPFAGLVRDESGNLYGTTSYGGSAVCDGGCGIVFKLSPSSGGPSGYTERVLYIFGQVPNDGLHPEAGLVVDPSGNLYGTTVAGGSSSACYGGCGTVFRLSPSSGSPSGYAETVLYNFAGVNDGVHPTHGLVADSSGNLYGTTYYLFGANNGGTVFKLDASNGFAETVLHSFGETTDDGVYPVGLTTDVHGNIYGTTQYGGVYGSGTVFKLDASNNYAETVLYNFGEATNDGVGPSEGPIMDALGNLYGAATYGGFYADGFEWSSLGTVFELSPSSSGPSAYVETILHNFGGDDDGLAPFAGLIMDKEGNLYGTAVSGGAADDGTVYELLLTIPFMTFNAKLAILSGPPPEIQLNSMFTLGSSGSINPPSQAVTLQVGSFSTTIPAGSFHVLMKGSKAGAWVYEGAINGVTIAVQIVPLGALRYQFKAQAEPVDLRGATNPVTVTITIGNNTGSTQVDASF